MVDEIKRLNIKEHREVKPQNLNKIIYEFYLHKYYIFEKIKIKLLVAKNLTNYVFN